MFAAEVPQCSMRWQLGKTILQLFVEGVQVSMHFRKWVTLEDHVIQPHKPKER